MRFEIAGTVRLALPDADERTERVACRELDPYGPIAGDGNADLTLEAMARLPAPIDVQNPAADNLVTASDGTDLRVIVGGRSCTVPRLALQGPFLLRYERGFPLAHIFGSIVRPTIQLALEDHEAVAVHSTGHPTSRVRISKALRLSVPPSVRWYSLPPSQGPRSPPRSAMRAGALAVSLGPQRMSAVLSSTFTGGPDTRCLSWTANSRERLRHGKSGGYRHRSRRCRSSK